MNVSSLSQANGADLLQRLTGGDAAQGAGEQGKASKQVLKTAVKEAQLNEAAVVNGGEPVTNGSLVNVRA